MPCEEYEALRARAAGHCELCKIPEALTRRGFLVIDHFHGIKGTSFIRGLLCDWCNQSVMQCLDGLKPWGANREWEAAAREYERHPWHQPSESALRQLAARTEMLPVRAQRRRDISRATVVTLPSRRGLDAMAARLREYLPADELAALGALLLDGKADQ
jgi:hypothetical protein